MDHLDGIARGDGPHSVSTEVAERVRALLAAAEEAAVAMRHEAEQEAQMRRRAVEEEMRRILDDARREADAFLHERQRRIAALSDTILQRAEQILARLDRAEDVRRQLQDLVDALGRTAQELSLDAAGAAPRTPHLPREPEPPAREPQRAVEEPPLVETEPVPEPGLADADVGEAEPLPDVVELPRNEQAEPEPEPQPQRGREMDHDEDLGARLVALQMAVAGANRGEVEAHLTVNFKLGDPARILDDVFGRGSGADKRVSWPEAVRGAGS